MSERGVFAVDRGVWDHPTLKSREPFSRREAWMWLISEAAWKDRRVRISGQLVEIKRGQLAASLRFMGSKWKWSAARVMRFLNELKTYTMIETANETGETIITICKYNEYQRVSLPSETVGDTDSETASKQHRNKVEDKEYKESLFSSPSERASDFPSNAFEQFWLVYPHKVGKQDAEKVFRRIRKGGRVRWVDLLAGLRRYVGKTDDRPWCNPSTWLNQGRWEDQPASAGVLSNGAGNSNHRASAGGRQRASPHDTFLAAVGDVQRENPQSRLFGRNGDEDPGEPSALGNTAAYARR